VVGWKAVARDNSSALQLAVARQPVVALVDAATRGFQFYKSGIYSSEDCGKELNHAVLVVGFGEEASGGVMYWIVQNSWGASWGDKGYIRLKRTSTNGPGQCGIATYASYPVVKPHNSNPPQQQQLSETAPAATVVSSITSAPAMWDPSKPTY